VNAISLIGLIGRVEALNIFLHNY